MQQGEFLPQFDTATSHTIWTVATLAALFSGTVASRNNVIPEQYRALNEQHRTLQLHSLHYTRYFYSRIQWNQVHVTCPSDSSGEVYMSLNEQMYTIQRL